MPALSRIPSPSALITRLAAMLTIAALVAGSAPAATAQSLWENSYIMQCFCVVEWDDPWGGLGLFDEDASRDTITLINGDAVVLIHEIPLDEGSLESMIEDRTRSLERSDRLDDVEVAWSDDSRSDAEIGRTWTGPDGDLVLGFQYVQVWETNYLLSIEIVAPENEFEDAWDSLDVILLAGLPLLNEFDEETVLEGFGE
jgi:hypothetical protein